jgi:hypothetical protein
LNYNNFHHDWKKIKVENDTNLNSVIELSNSKPIETEITNKSMVDINSNKQITKIMNTIVIRSQHREYSSDDIDETVIRMPKDRIKNYLSPTKTSIQKATNVNLQTICNSTVAYKPDNIEIMVPIKKLQMKPKFVDDGICGICCKKFSSFCWSSHSKGVLKIINKNNEHHKIHSNIMCKKCIKQIIKRKQTCPYCREEIYIRKPFILFNSALVRNKLLGIYTSIKNSKGCNRIQTCLMIPVYILLFLLTPLAFLIGQFMIFDHHNQEQIFEIKLKRIFFGCFLVLGLVSELSNVITNSHNTGEE